MLLATFTGLRLGELRLRAVRAARQQAVVVHFSYRVLDHGWAEAEIGGDGIHVVLTASYLSAPLDDLLEAVAELLEGSTEARCSWEEEPGEFRSMFVRGGMRLSFRVLWFEDRVFDPTSEEEARLLVRGEQELEVFAAAVADAAESLRLSTASQSTSASGAIHSL